MNNVVSITAEGRRELETELERLVAMRPEMAEKIATARSFGDLSENEDYSAARGEQKVMEGRILEIQGILKRAKIIKTGKKEKVVLGATVVLEADGRRQTYSVVGAVEANPLDGKISDVSPIGRAIMGKRAGESATLPNGRVYTVAEIQ